MKVISFCLWGDDPKYVQGAIRNAEIAEKLFPDWECWFYLPGPPIHPVVGQVSHLSNIKLILEPDRAADWTAMFLRFQPAAHPKVEAMISRDCDSRLSLREKVAVDAWMESDKGFHIMRDHPWHGSSILGGMWGCRNGILKGIAESINEYSKGNFIQVDQNFLREHVWPKISNNALSHDEFFNGVPFPKPRKDWNDFVGQVYDENDNPTQEYAVMLEVSQT